MTAPNDDPQVDADPYGVAGMSRSELGATVARINDELAALKETRQSLTARQSVLQAEIARRRAVAEAQTYEERRRRTITDGLSIPDPPKSMGQAAKPRAAAERLAGLSLGKPKPTVQVVATTDPLTTDTIRVADDEPVRVAVTDHALVRYMERVMGFDFDPIRERILTPTVTRALRDGVTRIRTQDGYVIAKESIVTTFLPLDAGPTRGSGAKVRNRPRPHERPGTDEIMEETFAAEGE
jgi:hypothetical protein